MMLRACLAFPFCLTGSVCGVAQSRVGCVAKHLTTNYREEHLLDATSEMARVRQSLKLVINSLIRELGCELSEDSSQGPVPDSLQALRRQIHQCAPLPSRRLIQVHVRLNAAENVLIVEKCSCAHPERAGSSESDQHEFNTNCISVAYSRVPRFNTNCIIKTECYHY